MIQLRDKTLASRALWQIGQSLRNLTREHGATFIVNDRLDIALAVEADGVHLGEEDVPISVARRLLGAAAVIGASVADPERARAAQAEGASYLGVGPVFETSSKPDAGAAVGTGPLAEIKRAVAIPVLAIGGVNCDNVSVVLRTGADGVAVISAVAEADDMAAAARALSCLIREARRAKGR
jgi:thiamine-phosphate pyrophosphorylase